MFDTAITLINAIAQRISALPGDGVQDAVARLAEQRLSRTDLEPSMARWHPALGMLPEVLAMVREYDPAIADGLEKVCPKLHWVISDSYTDEILGPGFRNDCAWAELIGPAGLFKGDDFCLGMLLLGPNRHYPDHCHPAPELYWPLTAPSLWKRDSDAFTVRQQGETIWHPSMAVHATITKEKPLLAIFVWTHDVATPASLCLGDTHAKPGGATKR